MAATTKKWLVAIAFANSGSLTASGDTYNGTARTKTGQTVSATTITTAAIIAGLMPTGSLFATAANIEQVGSSLSSSATRIVVFRSIAVPVADTYSAVTWTVGGVVYTANVMAIPAYGDPGLISDSEIAALTNFAAALSAALA